MTLTDAELQQFEAQDQPGIVLIRLFEEKRLTVTRREDISPGAIVIDFSDPEAREMFKSAWLRYLDMPCLCQRWEGPCPVHDMQGGEEIRAAFAATDGEM